MTDNPGTAGAEAAKLDLSLTQSHYSWLRTRLSIERTFMSWIRTATSLIGFGFTIFQFLDKLGRADLNPNAPRNFGLAFIATGVAAALLGWLQRRAEVAYLEGNEYESIGWRPGLPFWRGANVIAFVVAGIGTVAFLWVLIGW